LAGEQGGSSPDFQALVEEAGDLIYTLDLQGRFTYYNRAAAQVLGYPAGSADMLGVSFLKILTPSSAMLAKQHFAQALAGRVSTPFIEVEAKHRDSGIVNLEIRSGAIVRDGILCGRHGIARNITEIKSLQAMVAEKSQRMAVLEERMCLAMGMYARISDLVHANPRAGGAGDDEDMFMVEDALQKLSAGRHGMTALDITVLNLLAQGRSNENIASEVCRSPHTVKDMVKRIMLRLGAKRRAEAVACAIRLGLIASN
jgi:PAS domain S-box-containing protein